jgi:undecaprenyl-diphosphatase
MNEDRTDAPRLQSGQRTQEARRRRIRRWAPHAGAALLLGVVYLWDRPIYDAIRNFRYPILDSLTDRVSHLRGATFPIAIGLALVAWGALWSRTKIWRGGVALLLAAALSGAVVSVLKPTFARPGPGGAWTPKPGESWIGARYGRFPSSHAAVLFGSATALAAFLPATAPLGYAVAVLVCHERIYRATHFPSDIIAGVWIGLVAANLVIRWLARRESWRNDLSPSWLKRRWAGMPKEAAGIDGKGAGEARAASQSFSLTQGRPRPGEIDG